MILNLVPPPEKGKVFQWVMKNPSAVDAYFEAAYALSRMQVTMEAEGRLYVYPVTFTGREAVIDIILPDVNSL